MEMEVTDVEPVTEEVEETTEDVAEKPEPKESPQKTVENKKESKPEPKEEKKETAKEKAVKKILKKIDDKQKYDDVAQTKTLIVMQVLGDSKTFFDSQLQLNDRAGFFSNVSIPDATITDNSIAGYYLFAGSDGLMNDMIDSQWQK